MKTKCAVGTVLGLLVIASITMCVDTEPEQHIRFDTVWNGEYDFWAVEEDGDIGNESFFIFTDENEWISFLDKYSDRRGFVFDDFEDFFLIAAFQGLKPTGGYGIQISEIVQKGGIVKIKVDLKEPRPGERVEEAETLPYHIIKVEKGRIKKGEITFVFLDLNGKKLDTIEKIIS
ncbi:hypothetical protein C5S30_01670 [ANME-1 cluster archaeon GoMg4]|nr:hypothetical protein [ANME-1 cluster archaeon GoMg4]